MIHTVFFWIKPGTSDSELDRFKNELKTLLQSQYIENAYIGTPAPTEERDVTDHSFAVSITVFFKSMENHNAYQVEPAHHTFLENCASIWQKVQVFDSEQI